MHLKGTLSIARVIRHEPVAAPQPRKIPHRLNDTDVIITVTHAGL